MPAEVRRTGGVVELKIVAEHRQQMLLQPHHQRVDPRVEQDVGALEPHHRRIARGEVLDVDRGRDHRARGPQPLGDVPLHLRTEDEFGVEGGDHFLDLEIIVGDQRLDAILLGGVADVAGEFAVVAAEPDDLEAHLLGRDARGGDGVGRVAEDEHPLGGQIGRVDRARIPRQARGVGGDDGFDIEPGDRADFADEVDRRAIAHRHGADGRLLERLLEPARGGVAGLGIEQDVEVRRAEPLEVGGRRPHRRGDVDVDAEVPKQLGDLDDVVAVAEAERGRTEDVGERPAIRHRRPRDRRVGEGADEGVERLRRAPVLLALVARQLEVDHRDRQAQRLGEARGVVLDQFGGARRADQQRVGRKRS